MRNRRSARRPGRGRPGRPRRTGVLLAIVVAILLVFFGGVLRARLLPAREWLATTAFAGFVILAAALGMIGSTQAALAEASNAGALDTAQALNILDAATFP